ncbi:MAG: hypothetical protein BRC25_00850 [Parcubacteria group bacterium SW_6_46_9]|nr:MAG: hypothetical protein BRC25_00850 [Parcubacteria group bacterium SW_6_46_9]
MTKTNITIAIIVLLVLVGGAMYLERGEDPSYSSDTQQATTTQSTSTDTGDTSTTTEAGTAVSGKVVNYDASQVGVDGPYVLEITTSDSNITIEVPSMGLSACAAADNIADMSNISEGQTVSVLGDRQDNGAIVPCESSDHYLRIGEDQEDTSGEATEGKAIIGTSAGGHDIPAYTYGNGDTRLLFVGGIHGGYEWNTVKVADQMIEWLERNRSVIPENVSVTVIPVLNPDGLNETVGTTSPEFSAADVPTQEDTIPGRFNANDVDLNRNFDCSWQPEGQWQDRTVDAGSSAFSEPETQALRDWIQNNNPEAGIVFYSAAGAVYSAGCNGEASTASEDLMNTYAQASGYPAEGLFTAYELNGDAVDWMTKEGVTGISVLLSTHQDVEWDKNRAGIKAVLESYGQ